MYGISIWQKNVRPQVSSKGQRLRSNPGKTLKSNISKTVRDREKKSIEVR